MNEKREKKEEKTTTKETKNVFTEMIVLCFELLVFLLREPMCVWYFLHMQHRKKNVNNNDVTQHKPKANT